MRTSNDKLPKDVTSLCEQIVKGYERRKKDYKNKCIDIIYSHGSGVVEATAKQGTSDPCTAKTERLEQLEGSLDVKLMRAVEASLSMTGTDVGGDSCTRLHNAILLNCENGREFPYEVLNIDEFSRSDFYRRKRRFLKGIAEQLEIN